MAKRKAGQAAQRRSASGAGGSPKKKPIESYDHQDKKRANNPPVGLVTPDTDPDEAGPKTYQYDPHLDPQLVWAGKAEHTSFEVPTVSLHVHERIDPRTIIEATRRRNGNGDDGQMLLFEQPDANPPLREAIEFYKHAHNWTNRLIAGDSLLVMNSLLEKEGMAGKVQMVYIDPPYGIRYGSNFQPFVNKRDVKDGKDDDLTQEPEMIRAFRDTWELGIHSYLTYLRDRLLLARKLLHESGSCFLQISDDNLHHVREMMDEVFGHKNCVSTIAFVKTSGQKTELLSNVLDYLVWYAKDKGGVKYHQQYKAKKLGEEGTTQYVHLENAETGRLSRLTHEQILGIEESGDRSGVVALDNMTSQSPRQDGQFPVSIGDKTIAISRGYWKTNREGMARLTLAQRLRLVGNTVMYKRYIDDFPVSPINNTWRDVLMTGFSESKSYVVQTSKKVIARCMLMTTDPGDLVLDPTCGSGTTAIVAEQWGRRWITCDTSRVSIALAKQRLMTPVFDYYELAQPDEGVGSGFKYKTVPHVTLKSIANNPEIREGMSRMAIDAAIAKYADQETLYDRPLVDKKKARVSGPFTVEAVPAPAVISIAEARKDACATVAQASSLPDARQPLDAQDNADKMSALRHPELLSGTHDRGYLPHWKSEGATYFVTFRLAGTLPKMVLDEFDAERAELTDRECESGRSLTKADRRRLSELYSEKIDAYLDAGRGECWLARPEIAEIVSDSLEHFAGQRYELHAWTIMPNHVHVVVTPSERHSLSEILHSWKSYTATKANKLLDRRGQPFWQRESYDRLVRDEKEFHQVCVYTVENPVGAGLCERVEDWRLGSTFAAQASSLQQSQGEESRQDACATWTADASVGRSGETLRQDEWRDELLKCGIRGKKKQHIHFSRVEALPGTRWLHADAETQPSPEPSPSKGAGASDRERVVVSFGPEHAPLEQRQVEQALEEAQLLKPTPKMVVFASFQFDPEAAKDIDETNWPGITLLKVQMNTDLLTDDLKKKRSSNESFWMIGQPDVVVNSEQWLVDSRKEALAPYAIVAELSGSHSLAEINGLDRDDLSLFIAIAQGRDLWTAVTTDAGGGVDSREHRRGTGEARHGRVSTLPGHCAGLPGRIGDAGDFVRELAAFSVRDRIKRIERLRGSRETADRAREIAASLTGRSPLSTINYSQATIQGFDYYNPVDGKIESGDTSKIAMWMLDTDYDGRSLYPSQVFFPMAGAKDGWSRLAKNLKAEIDEELIEAYRGTVSLPFEPGDHERAAVKIIDDRGIESLKIVEVG